jgi:hypothetical protein
MAVYIVNANPQDFAIQIKKFLRPVIQGQNFGWTYKGEIGRVEKENQPFPPVIIQPDLHIQLIQVFGGQHFKIGRFLSD